MIKIMRSWLASTFSSETETGYFVPPFTVLLLSYHGFNFNTNLYRYQNVLKCMQSDIESWPKKLLLR